MSSGRRESGNAHTDHRTSLLRRPVSPQLRTALLLPGCWLRGRLLLSIEHSPCPLHDLLLPSSQAPLQVTIEAQLMARLASYVSSLGLALHDDWTCHVKRHKRRGAVGDAYYRAPDGTCLRWVDVPFC